MTVDKELERAIRSAFLKAAIAMGDDLKTISWFGRHYKKD